MPKINSLKKARQLSAEGLQVVTKKVRQQSAEGLEAVSNRPRYISAEGLQVALDSSPEVVPKYSSDEKIPADGRRPKNIKNRMLNSRLCGIRVIWIAITISIFVIGIVFGGAVVTTIEAKRKTQPSAEGQSNQGTSSTTQSSVQSTLLSSLTSGTSTSTTKTGAIASTSSTNIPIAQSEVPTTASFTSSATFSSVVATSTSTSGASTNLQTFTSALGGVTADAITSSGNTARPFLVDGSTFIDLASAIQRSCANQHNGCADIAATQTAPITVAQCDTQQASCLAAGNTTQTAS